MAGVRTTEKRLERVAVVGDGPEFRPLLDHLRDGQRVEVHQFASLDQLVTLKSLRRSPHRVLLLQSRAGQFSPLDVEIAKAAISEAAWLCVVGSYTEGETRSGQPLVGIERVHWTSAIDRLNRLRGVWDGEIQIPDESHLGLGAHPADRLVALNEGPRPFPYSLGVVAASVRLGRAVREACTAVGFSDHWLPARLFEQRRQDEMIEHLSLCLWVSESVRGRGPVPLAQVVAHLTPCPVLVLADFVREDDYQSYVRQGATGVVARPFVLEDLVGHVSRLARPSIIPAHPSRQRHAS